MAVGGGGRLQTPQSKARNSHCHSKARDPIGAHGEQMGDVSVMLVVESVPKFLPSKSMDFGNRAGDENTPKADGNGCGWWRTLYFT